MGFLILSRREGEGITPVPQGRLPGGGTDSAIARRRHPILVTDIIGNQARAGIEAPRGVLIVRDELKTAPKG
ncbi:carbon storage regulator [Pseudomonas aeruginosa]